MKVNPQNKTFLYGGPHTYFMMAEFYCSSSSARGTKTDHNRYTTNSSGAITTSHPKWKVTSNLIMIKQPSVIGMMMIMVKRSMVTDIMMAMIDTMMIMIK